MQNAKPNHPLFKTGKTHDSNGYVVFSSGEHKGRREHRVVVENAIGRSLESGEVVHHKDGNKANNDAGNLAVLSRLEHSRSHGRGSLLTCSKCGKRHWYSQSLLRLLKTPYLCRSCYRVRVVMSNQKLSKSDADQIKALRLAGVSGSILAMRYGVSEATICDIYKGRRHK